MDVVHIAQADNGMVLVTYVLTNEEFQELHKEAVRKGELEDDKIILPN